MPLPNLSGKTFDTPTLDSYQSGADSYREKVREKIQSSPRQNTNYTRSIDLSLTSDNSFRPVSRSNKSNNSYVSSLNDTNSVSRLKSARSRQLIFYNNNGELNQDNNNDNTNNNNNNNSENDLRREAHRKNNTRNRNFLDTSPLVSDDDFSFNTSDEPVRAPQPPLSSRRNLKNNNNNNNNDSYSIAPATPRETSSVLKAPLITPRKSVLQKQYQPQQQQQQPPPQQSKNEDNDFLTNYESNRSRLRSSITNRSYDLVASRTTFREDNLNGDDDNDDVVFDQETSSGKPNHQQTPPVPVPRKREQPPVYLNTMTNSDEIRIRRNNSASSNKRNGYMPSPRSNPTIPQNEQLLQQQQPKYIKDANVPIIKSNTGLLNGRKSSLRLRSNQQELNDNRRN